MSCIRHGSSVRKALGALVLAASCVLVSPGASAGIVALSGQVTSHLTGEPLAHVRVSIDVPSTDFGDPYEIGYAFTDADGLYDWTGDCESLFALCEVVAVDPPYLAAAGSFDQNIGVAVVDLALITPSTASGTLRFPDGLASQMTITADRFASGSGFWETVSSASVAADGSFVIGQLPFDTYRFCTIPEQNGAIRQCFDHVDLAPFAGEPDATLVAIGEDVAVTGIDFDIVRGGTLSGTIYDGYIDGPLENDLAEVTAYDANGNWLLDAIAEPTGDFHLRGLPDGTFYLGVNIGGPFADSVQFYPGIVCTFDACPPPTTGTPLTIDGANEITGLDFTVHPQVVVSGRVTEAETGAGIGGVAVGLYDSSEYGLTTSAPGDGSYVFYWYADESFQVGASGAPPRIDTVYPAAHCIGSYCFGDIVPINAQTGAVLSNIDLPMPLGAAIAGHIAREASGDPGYAEIVLYDASYMPIWSGQSTDGAYAIDGWLPGTYYVEAFGTYTLSGCAFYLDRPCPGHGGNPADVDPTPITLTTGEIRSDVDFRLPGADSIFASGFEPGFTPATRGR